MRILDNDGNETTLAVLNERAAAWHEAHDPKRPGTAYWRKFYAARDALVVEQHHDRTLAEERREVALAATRLNRGRR